MNERRLVIVGGGITGLAAAHEVADVNGWHVTVLEAGDRFGGKILTSDFVGRPVDEAADAFLRRVPDALRLCAELGLADDLVSPRTSTAHLWTGDGLRAFPGGSVMGVPLWPDAAVESGIISPAGIERAMGETDRHGPPLCDDVTIGAFLDERLGQEVSRRLVAPLVGGINAGAVDRLSLDAVLPQLSSAARSGPSLIAALRDAAPAPTAAATTAVFAGLTSGTGHLIEQLVASLRERGVELELDAGVDLIEPRSGPGGTTGSAMRVLAGDRELIADAVVVTTPAHRAASLIRTLSVAASDALGAIPTASVVMVTLAWPRDQICDVAGSGVLVPREEQRTVSAISWASNKWAHLDDGETAILRVSAGHADDPTPIDLDDGTLLERVVADVADITRISGPPNDVRISRWRDGFPQYEVGHLSRCDAVDHALRDSGSNIAVTGAGHRGLGIPACIRQGRDAARLVMGAAS